ncbi:MAG TPA: DUF6011 domain-containing protein [Longimicrobiales bacterium]
MTNLTQLAMQIESQQQNEQWAAHKAEFAKQEAAQEEAAYLAEMEEEKALGIGPSAPTPTVTDMTEVPESVLVGPERLQAVLIDGGYATVSMKNTATGKHVTLQVVGRKRKPDGKGWISRQTALGRVGLAAGDVLEVRDPDREYPDNYVGRWYKGAQGGWKAGQGADVPRAKAAHKLLDWALAGGDMWTGVEVRLATRCSECGRKLTHPESIDIMTGPECAGKKTAGQAAPHVAPKAVA